MEVSKASEGRYDGSREGSKVSGGERVGVGREVSGGERVGVGREGSGGERVGVGRKVSEGRDVGNDGKRVIGREEIRIGRGGQMANTIVRGNSKNYKEGTDLFYCQAYALSQQAQYH